MDIITLYLLLGVASGVLHPAQGCKILVNNPPAPQARGGLKENIQFFSYRLAKPSKPIFFPKVEKSEAN